MKKILIGLLIGLVFNFCLADSLSYSLDVVSRYIFRGIESGQYVNFNDDQGENYNNSPAIQPGMEYAFSEKLSGLKLGFWSTIGLGNKSTQKIDEFDPYIGYDFSVGDVDYSLGYTYYVFPSIMEYQTSSLGGEAAPAKSAIYNDLHEYWLSLALPKAMFEPSLTIFHGKKAISDSFYSYGILELSLPEIAKDINTGLSFGFTGYSGSTRKATLLTDITLSLSKDVTFAGVEANAFVNYIGLIGHKDKEALPTYYINDEKNSYELVFGLSFAGNLL